MVKLLATKAGRHSIWLGRRVEPTSKGFEWNAEWLLCAVVFNGAQTGSRDIENDDTYSWQSYPDPCRAWPCWRGQIGGSCLDREEEKDSLNWAAWASEWNMLRASGWEIELDLGSRGGNDRSRVRAVERICWCRTIRPRIGVSSDWSILKQNSGTRVIRNEKLTAVFVTSRAQYFFESWKPCFSRNEHAVHFFSNQFNYFLKY